MVADKVNGATQETMSLRPRPIQITVDGINDVPQDRSKSPMSAYPGSPIVKMRLTLAQAWKDADNEFYKKTRRRLMTSVPTQKQSVISMWSKVYERENSEEMKKYNQMVSLLETILSGVEVVGAFAAQAASMVFAPASMCFSAIQFLIDAPRTVKKVYDDLRELFERVKDFLVRFKVLKRIDDKAALDPDLVENANNMLISFTRICSLSIELLEKRKLSTALKAVFLKDDSGVSTELKQFEKLAESGSMLTGVVTLEHVLSVKELQKDILSSASETNILVRSLAAASTDEKTKLVNKERLATIMQKLFVKGDRFLDEYAQPPQSGDDLLPGTLQALEECDAYQEWKSTGNASRTPLRQTIVGSAIRAALILTGGLGTGKTRLLEAVKEQLDNTRETASKDDPSTYVAFHAFSGKRDRSSEGNKKATDGKLDSSIPHALRCIAYQVACQSTSYAKALEKQMVAGKNLNRLDASDLWTALGLSTFPAPPHSTLWLLFDSLEQERDENINSLINIFVGRNKGLDDTLRVRVLFAGDLGQKTGLKLIGTTVPSVSMPDISSGLIQDFVRKELERLRLFQGMDKKTTKQRKRLDEVLKEQQGQGLLTFGAIRQKLELLQEAERNDLSSKELDRIMSDEPGAIHLEEGRKLLADLATSLNAKDIIQLNQILRWLLYAELPMDLDEVEAVLYLEEDAETLQPLRKKIKNRYSQILQVYGQSIYVDPIMSSTLQENEDDSRAGFNDEPLVSLNISIQNATEPTVRQFVWQLNEQMVSGKFDFFSNTSAGNSKIYVNKVEGHLAIVRLCFKLLNEGYNDQTETIVYYARDYLPRHLSALKALVDKVSDNEKTLIGQGLVGFLRHPYEIAPSGLDFGSGEPWLNEEETIKYWLNETVDRLQPHDRRWVKKVITDPTGRLSYMHDVARAVATTWLSNVSGVGYQRSMFDWLYSFVTKNTAPEETTTIEAATTSNETEQEADLDSEHDKPLMENADAQDATTETLVDESASALERTSTTTEVKADERMLRVLGWVSKNTDIKPNALYHLNVGFAIDDYEVDSVAVEHFTMAVEDPDTRRRALIGISRIEYKMGKKEEALTKWREAMDILKGKFEKGTLSDDERDSYRVLLEELADWLEELDRPIEAVPYLKQALELKRDEFQIRWRALKLLCKGGQIEEAIQLLGEWRDHVDEHGGKSPADACYESIENNPYDDQITSLLGEIRDDTLRSILIDALQEASKIARKTIESSSLPGLLVLQGMAIAMSPDEGRWEQVFELWDDALLSAPPEYGSDWRYRVGLTKASKAAAMCKFDQLRARLLANPGMPQEEKEELLRKLKQYIATKAMGDSDIFNYGGLANADAYSASMMVLTDHMDNAREFCSPSMADALEILSDSDPDNDCIGIRDMMKVFALCHDKVGVFTAFSLLDRQQRRANKPATNGESEMPASEATIDPFRVPEDTLTGECSICRKKVSSADADGFCWCLFCTEPDFCIDCVRKMQGGDLRWYSCNPKHEFVHLRHTEYADEDIAEQKIRIEWDMEDLGDGRFDRKGGRVVDLQDWIKLLREAWKIPEPESESRAQK